ncbi:DUF952 domain-containing protein [Aureimonas sp. AU4]|uniref:DUF952 domain-containing protein n=1 Tax=Aureimonas sp. AU4 TaxID=1638163 RepID=UPI0007804139|nr:DUF952 domain-containing protein [Aureimonas sp. AU4]
MSPHAPIYKLLSRDLWLEAEDRGRFEGSAVDRQDGFIHFSTGAQVRETAAKHFSDERSLVMVAVDPAVLGGALRWEPSRGGALFPHLYEPLSLDAVLYVEDIDYRDGDGHHFPDSLR